MIKINLKKFGKLINEKNFALVMTSRPSARPSVRNPTMLMRPCLFCGKLHGEMRLQQKSYRTQNTKSIHMYLLDMMTNVERRERERKRKQEKRRRLSKVQRERERRIAS